MNRILAVDYGKARIGGAVSDALGISTRPLPAIESEGLPEDAVKLCQLCKEEEVGEIVIGLPLQLDGKKGLAAKEVAAFCEAVREETGLPVHQVDERLTSKQAHSMLKAGGVRHKKRKELVDSTAALLILKSFLAQRKP